MERRFEGLSEAGDARYVTLHFKIWIECGHWCVCWRQPDFTERAQYLLRRFGAFGVNFRQLYRRPVTKIAGVEEALDSWEETFNYINKVREQVVEGFRDLERKDAEFHDNCEGEFYINI